MEKAISAAEANRKFSQVLREVREGLSFIVTSHGKPVAKITPHTKSASNVLQLTSVSPSGSTGGTVTRRVLVQTPKKPKPKRRK